MPNFSFLPAIFAMLALAACVTTPPPDLELVRISDAIQSEVADFHAKLAAKPSPDCGYESNRPAYASLAAQTGQLNRHLAGSQASPLLKRAGSALANAIEAARASHALASARSDDLHGLCMAPDAIALNAQALNRAAAAVSASQNHEGGS